MSTQDKKPIKPFLTHQQQIKLLEDRGLTIDMPDAEYILSQLNYYRFINAYGLSFINKSTNTYVNATTFSTLYKLYEFDRVLRHILSEYIEKIEIKLRSLIAYHSANTYGALGYLDKTTYSPNFDLNKFIDTLEKEKEKQKNVTFLQHYKQYEEIPSWVAVEYIPFGTLSIMYQFFQKDLQNKILKDLVLNFNTKPYYLANWIQQIVHIRNICAHYSRLYNKELEIVKLPDYLKQQFPENKLFAHVYVICCMLSEDDINSIVTNLDTIINSYNIILTDIGFPSNWHALLTDLIK
ncbi:MAG: Abi family protein [Clostridia bacterium]|nr:Abi family protein [Clostridia bacterium]